MEVRKLIQNSYYEYNEKSEVIIDILEKNPTSMMNYILPYITTKSIIEPIYLQSNDEDWRYDYKCNIYSNFKVDTFSKITHMELSEYGIVEGDGENKIYENYNTEFEINLDVGYFNKYSGEGSLIGKFTGGGDMLMALDYSHIEAELYVTGLEKDTECPSWIDYLIEGCLEIENKNNKMAFLNIFASFDNFINDIHEDIFEYYIDDYGKCTNENVKREMKEKIRLFSNKEKKLRNKRINILNEIGFKKGEEFNKCITMLDKYTEQRDKIAHGGIFEDTYKIGEVIYNILTIMFSILSNEDFAKNQWASIVIDWDDN